MADKIVKAPAKINLTLDVLHKRDDGYHEVEMIMTTVDLADRIHLTVRPNKAITVESNNGFIPTDKNNLAFQAAFILQERYHVQSGVRIFIDKLIPMSAGLAGGSTDAAAVLRGLNDLWELGLSIEELADIGAEIGSDVPFCVHGKTALATGRGEKLTFIDPPPPCWVVLAKPPMGVSTKEIYGKLNLKTMEHPKTEQMIKALEEQNFSEICALLQNVMEPATFELAPDVKLIKDRLVSFGAEGTVMSGSGPTVFALARSESKAIRLSNGLKGFMDHVFVVRILGE
ncbi:4-(cytidine 5'-diphospho)-2-C-methyl-D-erythritol kinase [Paenalkalicoccus suaedae]|uniref:4-diphosphocytidyl-2-C-methyl-D-erythritol kinase n=1 Tax=Paenalkalicoccus suaedae TaxID=2592382 RepID=A0A859F9U7_9BACI|nr:4-(cytidine 5'-diphospho)-2-C-methyl-D-erythritol kinase [Paenalkalicoccus suaedae]QKS69637.1 4-(cytidine 5'-diphospho)-2-C-methyl-D-erythritol kinase [Paenalkalicoccus suaedae]